MHRFLLKFILKFLLSCLQRYFCKKNKRFIIELYTLPCVSSNIFERILPWLRIRISSMRFYHFLWILLEISQDFLSPEHSRGVSSKISSKNVVRGKKSREILRFFWSFFFWNSIRYSDFFLCTSSPKVLLATASESIPCHFSIFFKRNSSMNTRRGSINSSKNNCIQKFILWKIPPCFNILQEICALF